MSPLERLRTIMARLRDPNGGCAWDLQQTYATIAPYTIEEAYEVADAIARNDMDDLREELGDLLLQVVFHAQMAAESGHFTFDDVATSICDKMVRRHPHVFVQAIPEKVDTGGMAIHKKADARTAEQQTTAWETQKAAERAQKAADTSVLANIPANLPGLTRAVKLTARAARVGFDWPDAALVLDKLREETDEISEVIAQGSDADRLEDEVGDLMFVCANLARKLNVDPDAALRRTNAKFTRRFDFIEQALLAQNKRWEQTSLAEMEILWVAAKAHERD